MSFLVFYGLLASILENAHIHLHENKLERKQQQTDGSGIYLFPDYFAIL